ncbi:MAG: hypothetical protein DDT27_00147 [Dehalococcoidia bacterium]|nr:hypothetical protein [Chloroflexota bacterium]
MTIVRSALNKPCPSQSVLDSGLIGSIENRGYYLETEILCCPAKVAFQELPNIHARGDTQRAENDIHRPTISQVRHVFNRKYPGNDPLIAMTTGQLITHRDLPLLGHRYPYHFTNARIQFIAGQFLQRASTAFALLIIKLHTIAKLFLAPLAPIPEPIKALDIYHLTRLPMRHSQRGVLDVPCLFTKDSPK